jgi:hypothetical protein
MIIKYIVYRNYRKPVADYHRAEQLSLMSFAQPSSQMIQQAVVFIALG